MRTPFLGMLLACILWIAPQTALADEVRFPELTGPVVDLVDEIPADREAKLDADLRAFKDRTGHQLQIAIVPDMQGLDREDYANRLFRHWKLGRAGVNDGILLLHSIKERKIRIEVGRGAEPYLTDAQSSRILSGIITPAFKEGRFADGVIDGSAEIMNVASVTPEQRAEDERRAAAESARRAQAAKDGFFNFLLFIFWGAVIGAAVWSLWRLATLPRRRREAEEARLDEIERRRKKAERDAQRAEERRIEDARIAEAARVAAAAREKAEREAAEARERERNRLAKEREDMLAAMTPSKRKAFLEQEELQRQAEIERQRREEEARQIRLEKDRARRQEEDRQRAIAAAAAAAVEEERRAERRRQEARDEENRRSTSTWSSPSPSPSSSSDSWSGGGGDSGGGGAGGDY